MWLEDELVSNLGFSSFSGKTHWKKLWEGIRNTPGTFASQGLSFPFRRHLYYTSWNPADSAKKNSKTAKPALFVGFKSQWWQQVTSHDLVYETQMSNASRSGTWNAWQSTPFSFCPIWTFSLGPYLTCAVIRHPWTNKRRSSEKTAFAGLASCSRNWFLTIADMRCGSIVTETSSWTNGRTLKDPVFGSGKLDWSGIWVFSWWGFIFQVTPGLRDVARLIDYVGYPPGN